MGWTRKRTVTGPDGTYTETTRAEGEARMIAPGVRFIATEGKSKKSKGRKKSRSDD
ncbi:hypothetical protein [Streptomyces pinistramenti]|uniref:hypothetical protein n=1 Tax=Streptomyces pinistramenti TaxID=2884812 RepID=UPI001D0989F9|nr:hypothetical protein [Streptomyces pinistramenti]MCB5910351.1 hypothetical protein [Streptomyces pinistramenti]